MYTTTPLLMDRDKAWQLIAERCYFGGELVQDLIDLLKKMAVTDPQRRITLQEVLEHPLWHKQYPTSCRKGLPVGAGRRARARWFEFAVILSAVGKESHSDSWVVG